MDIEGKGKMIQSLVRAASILEYLADYRKGDRLSNISRNVGLSKSTVHSLISTLEKLGYVHQDQTNGRYALGLKLFELGQVVHASMDLRTIAMPYLHALADKYQETVHLAILSRDEVVYIDKVDSPRSIRIISQIGGRNPAHCTAVGKVLLAGLAGDKLERVLRTMNLQRFTPNTVTDPVRLRVHLAKVRELGYAEDREEIETGLTCVAAPLKNYCSEVIAAISLSGPAGRIASDNLSRLTADVVDTARLISAQLGCKN